jgi:hypothetical protein
MTDAEQDQPDPELHVVDGVPGHTYETPLTLGPDSDHLDDPVRHEGDATQPTQPSDITPASN